MTRHTRQRRKVLIDANNHDRWIVSYADFITLLFAFFVVMYSISSVNQGKYRSLTESLGTAFSNIDTAEKVEKKSAQISTQPETHAKDALSVHFEFTGFNQSSMAENAATASTLTAQPFIPSQIDPALPTDSASKPDLFAIPFESVTPDNQTSSEMNTTPTSEAPKITPDSANSEGTVTVDQSNLQDSLSVPFESTGSTKPTSADLEKTRELSAELVKERKQLNQVSDQLETALAPFIDDNLVSVKRNDFWIELDMNSELLFLSGEAALSPKAQPALEKIAEVVNTLPNAINVEGHTDNVPIETLVFPSNWELSSARATSVVQELIKKGTDPTRLSAIGYGEFHPIGDNDTEEGRFNNRRVTMVLMSQAFSRYGANDEERAKLLNLAPTNNP